jgi:hypothetical protein
MLAAAHVALRAGPGITAAASADPFSGEIFWTGGTAPVSAAAARTQGSRPPPARSWWMSISTQPLEGKAAAGCSRKDVVLGLAGRQFQQQMKAGRDATDPDQRCPPALSEGKAGRPLR